MKVKTEKVEHYLITIDLTRELRMHCYLMCSDDRCVRAAYEHMMELAEKCGFTPFPVILSTKLDTGVELVRNAILAHHDVEFPTESRLKRLKRIYYTTWMMPTNDPHDKSLMELH